MNISENFIRQADRDQPSDGGDRAVRRHLPIARCRSAIFRRSTIRRSTVYASLPGANPDTMASAVATPLERQFTSIAGLDSMTSNSGQGSTSITLQFDLSREIDGADSRRGDGDRRGDAPAAPGDADAAFVPQGRTRATCRSSASSSPLPRCAFRTSTSTPRPWWRSAFRMVDGVAQVQVFGAAKYAVRVQVDPNKLASPRDRPERSRPGAARVERQHPDRHAVRPEAGLTTSRPTAS